MRPNRHFSRNAVALATVATATLVVFACTDVTEVASPKASPIQEPSGLLASGLVYNAIWQPADGRLSFKGAVSVPLRLSNRNGVAVASAQGPATADSDAAFAEQLQRELTAAHFRSTAGAMTSYAMAGTNGRTKTLLRGRSAVTRTIDGNTIRLAYSPDDDKASGRPPKALMIWENDKPAAILQFSYAKRNGVWRAISTRALFLDASGKVVLVSDQNQAALSYASRASAPSILGRVREGSGEVLRMLAQTFKPDMLYAAPADEEACWEEALAATVAAAVVVAAAANSVAAEAALMAANVSYLAALASCVESPLTCPAAVLAAELAIASATAWVVSANVGLAAAITAAGIASAALTACIWPDQQTGLGGGGEGACVENEEEWCQWTIWYNGDGEVVDVEEDYCWCQEERMQ